MTVIAHVSDVHFGSEAPQSANALLAELNREPLDLVILSGDLTLAAKHSEFRKARLFIESLAAPTLCVPGNHDITPYHLWERFTDPYKRWRAHVSPSLEPSWAKNGVAVLGINTARRFRLAIDWSHGTISKRQINALKRRFAVLPESRFKIVVAHHPFLEEDTEDLGHRPRVMVKRAPKALQEFAEQEVDLVTAGHLHRTYAASFEAIQERSSVLSTGSIKRHTVTIIQAGTAISGRTRGEANSFNRIEIDGDRLCVHVVARQNGEWRRSDAPLVEIERP